LNLQKAAKSGFFLFKIIYVIILHTMFKYLKAVFGDSKIRNRIFYVIAILAVTRILSAIPIPSIAGADIAKYLESNQFLGLLNIFAGGGLSTLSIVMLGVQPYITASIIMQLLTVLVPSLKVMSQEEGEMGRRKFAQYSRWMTPVLAVMQGAGLLALFVKNGVIPAMSNETLALNLLIITAGSMIMMWLGETINEKGIGNGLSMIIFSGIVATLPTQIINALSVIPTEQIPLYIALAITFVLVLMGIVAVTEAERPLEVTYAKQSRGYSTETMATSYLPLRLTMAGVIPVIFAVSVLMFPQLLAQLMATSDVALLKQISTTVVSILSNQWIYGVIYFSLIVIFTFFYTAVTFDPLKTSENLQKGGAFIPGQRPGDATTEYISNTLMKVTAVGAVFLATVAILPLVLSGATGIATLSVGGTSLLIAVSVVIDLLKKIDAQLTMREY